MRRRPKNCFSQKLKLEYTSSIVRLCMLQVSSEDLRKREWTLRGICATEHIGFLRILEEYLLWFDPQILGKRQVNGGLMQRLCQL